MVAGIIDSSDIRKDSAFTEIKNVIGLGKSTFANCIEDADTNEDAFVNCSDTSDSETDGTCSDDSVSDEDPFGDESSCVISAGDFSDLSDVKN